MTARLIYRAIALTCAVGGLVIACVTVTDAEFYPAEAVLAGWLLLMALILAIWAGPVE